MKFVVEKAALGPDLPQTLRVSPVDIIPLNMEYSVGPVAQLV